VFVGLFGRVYGSFWRMSEIHLIIQSFEYGSLCILCIWVFLSVCEAFLSACLSLWVVFFSHFQRIF